MELFELSNFSWYFSKPNFSTPSLKNSFSRRTLRVFHYCFFRCFYFTILFEYFHCWFHLFNSSSLFLHFIILLLFFECFLLRRFCVVVWRFERAFFTLRRFLTYTLSRCLAKSAFMNDSMEPVFQPWRLMGLPLRFETQTPTICLFESHSIQQKVLVDRFHLCIRGCYRLLH